MSNEQPIVYRIKAYDHNFCELTPEQGGWAIPVTRAFAEMCIADLKGIPQQEEARQTYQRCIEAMDLLPEEKWSDGEENEQPTEDSGR